jgi:molybdopterin converting factor subunit 1
VHPLYNPETMLVHIRLFAILRQQAGVSELELELPDGSGVMDAAKQVGERFPAILKYLVRSAYAVNQSYVTADTKLNDGDELALIPPVSGGTDNDWIDILPTPLHTQAAIGFVSSANAGGINIFLGTTRSEINSDGKNLLALDYEAYHEMALKQLHAMAAQARKDWPIARLVLLHRIGHVPVGHPSVLIAVASPHRAEAFAACRWLIDTLKKEVTIWKKEIWEGGNES